MGRGIPYVAEHDGLPEPDQLAFQKWSGTTLVKFCQGALGDAFLRPTTLTTNLDLRMLSTLPNRGIAGIPPKGRAWTDSLRTLLAQTLSGFPPSPSCEELDRVIAKGFKATAFDPPEGREREPAVISNKANAGTAVNDDEDDEGTLDDETEAL